MSKNLKCPLAKTVLQICENQKGDCDDCTIGKLLQKGAEYERLEKQGINKVMLELTKREAQSLQSFIEEHNKPCDDCSPDTSCAIYERGFCIAKNMDAVLEKVRKLNEE